jgi:hydroxyacylglutathione hydrolase
VVTVCNSAYRSSMAVGVLERKGFRLVSSLEGGSEAWIKAGLPVLGPERMASSPAAVSSATVTRALRLPERMESAELRRLIMDLPGTFELVDMRPPAQFADYNIPGARNVDIGELMINPIFLSGSVPLIVVDRDGSLSMAIAGILSQKTQRTIKVLHGGVEGFWAESELRNAVKEVVLPARSGTATTMPAAGRSAVPASPAGPSGGSNPPAAPPSPAKSKSAGC